MGEEKKRDRLKSEGQGREERKGRVTGMKGRFLRGHLPPLLGIGNTALGKVIVVIPGVTSSYPPRLPSS